MCCEGQGGLHASRLVLVELVVLEEGKDNVSHEFWVWDNFLFYDLPYGLVSGSLADASDAL